MSLLPRQATFPTGPGRTYSVWDWDKLAYDYYWDPKGPADPQGWDFRPGPARTAPVSGIGDPFENLLRELPSGARHIGSGPDAKGEVVVRNRRAAVYGRVNVPGRASGTGTAGLGGTPEDAAGLLPVILAGGVIFLVLGGLTKLRSAL